MKLKLRRVLPPAVLLLLVTASAVTGRAASPFILPLVAALVVFVRHATSPVQLLAPVAAGFIIALVETLVGGSMTRGIVAGVLLVAAGVPGWLWRREAARSDRRLSQLDDILAQARRGRTAEEPAAAAELADLQNALASIADRIGARSVMLWDVEVYLALGRVRVASGGRTGQSVLLPGDQLGWVWEQGMRLRLDPAPRWAEEGTVVVADRLRYGEEGGLLVTYAFDPAYLPVDDPPFVEAAVYLRGFLALQEARATAAAGRRSLDALLQRLDPISRGTDIDAVAGEICAAAMEITNATGAAVATWTGESGQILAVAGPDGGPVPGDVFEPPGSELGLAVRAGTMITRDPASWSLGRTTFAHPGERWLHRPRSMAALPLHSAAEIHGVLAVWSARRRPLDPDALDLLKLLAPLATLHIERARTFGELRHTAERDPLTQLRNRRAFDEVFESERDRFARHGRPLSLLAVDLDHFKSINDRFGHEAGDDVLCRTARIIEASIRDIDTAARFGGEEFVVLLPETGLAAALDVAERIRAAVAESDLDFRGQAIPVRASVGVSACPDRVALPADLMASADAALYRAKAAGRNRVVAAPL